MVPMETQSVKFEEAWAVNVNPRGTVKEKENQPFVDVRIGRFAGFDLFLRTRLNDTVFNNTVEVVLRGRNSCRSF